MLSFLKIYRTKQNFTGHVLRYCGFGKSGSNVYLLENVPWLVLAKQWPLYDSMRGSQYIKDIGISQCGDSRYMSCIVSSELKYIHTRSSKMTLENCHMTVFSWSWSPPEVGLLVGCLVGWLVGFYPQGLRKGIFLSSKTHVSPAFPAHTYFKRPG